MPLPLRLPLETLGTLFEMLETLETLETLRDIVRDVRDDVRDVRDIVRDVRDESDVRGVCVCEHSGTRAHTHMAGLTAFGSAKRR
jgi:hypothetical protein